MLSIVEKQEIIKKFGTDEKDTGSSAVQVALMTKKIALLTEHLKEHKHDHHSRLGLLKTVGKRRNLLNYVKNRDVQAYRSLIKELKLRK